MNESDQPLSRYCELVGLRRLAILRGDEETAAALFAEAQALIDAGEVSDSEMLAAAYGA